MPVNALAAILVASVCAMPANVMPVLVRLLAETYTLNEAQIGYMISANTFAGLLSSVTAPYWITRVNLRHAAAVCLVLHACALVGLSVAPGLPALFGAQMVMGATAIVISSICLTVLLQLKNPARALSFKITSDIIFAGTFLAVLPVEVLGLRGFVIALVTLFGLAVVLAVPRLPAHALERSAVHVPLVPISAAPLSAWFVLAALMAFHVGGAGVWVFLGRLSENAGFDQGVTANVIAAGLFAGIVGSLGAAYAAGGVRRIGMPVTSGLLFVASIPALALTSSLIGFTAAVFVFNAAWNFFTPFLMSLLAARDPSKRMSSLIPASAMVGGILGPALMGNLLQSTSALTATSAMASASAISIAAFVVLARRSEVFTSATRDPRSGPSAGPRPLS